MRTKSIKRNFVLLILCCFTLLCSSVGFLTFKRSKAYAEASFDMVEGASVYVYDETEETLSGIRFMAKVPESLKDKAFTVLIVHKEMLTANDKMTGNRADINVNGDVAAQLMTNYGFNEEQFAQKFTVIERPAVYKDAEDGLAEGYYVYGSMVNLPESVFARDFVGFVYYTEGEARTYAALPTSGITGVTRNIEQVANKALGCDFDRYYADGHTDALLAFADSFGDETVAYGSAYYNMKSFSQWYKTTTQVEIVSYTDNAYTGEVNSFVEDKQIGGESYRISTTVTDEIASPVEGENKYLVKNTILPTGNATAAVSVPFWFDSSDARYALPTALRTQLKALLDADKEAAFNFRIYNAMGTKMTVYSKDATGSYIRNGEKLVEVAKDSWGLIQLPLDETAITLGATAAEDSYKFGVGLEGENLSTMPVYLNLVDGDNTISSKQIFYTDDICFVEPIAVNGASESFIASYAANTIAKKMTTDTQYLHNGSKYAIKVDVNGATGRYDTLGTIENNEGCSLTGWDNVVLTADIYNEGSTALSIGLQFIKDDARWTNNGLIEEKTVGYAISLPAGKWTTVSWSMKVLGISTDMFANGITVQLNVPDADTYSLAIANLDFVDYDAEKFPDIELYYGELNPNTSNFNRDLLPKRTGTEELETVTFEYSVVTIGATGCVKVALRTGSSNADILGFFEFDANGAKADGGYDGVTVTNLGNGYNRVVITVADVTQTAGSPDLTTIDVIHFARLTDATYYVANITATYKTAA